MADPTLPLAGLSPVDGNSVVVRFDGGHLSLDGGRLALREVTRRLKVTERLAACVMTLGGQGAVAADGGRLWRVRALPVDVVDTTGAGDTFTGVLAAALDAGLSLPDGLLRAAAAAGMPPVEAVG